MPTDFIDGPAGRLECCLDIAPEPSAVEASCAALLCHPHPQFGGSMHDNALGMINQTLLACGINTLRFNFRGVGASEGEHDSGRGETDDIVAAADWLRHRNAPQQLILCGYSFGGAMALQAQSRVLADKLILLAPAVSLAADFETPEVPTLVLLGDSDQFIKVDDARAAMDVPNVSLQVFAKTDHFFMGAAAEVSDHIRAWLGLGS